VVVDAPAGWTGLPACSASFPTRFCWWRKPTWSPSGALADSPLSGKRAPAGDRVRLVLNRYKKIPGFSDEDVEKATDCRLLWKLPNNYQAIAPAIDKGVPVSLSGQSDIGRSFRQLANTLAEASATTAGSLDLAYKQDKPDRRKSRR